jgi:thioredoxin 1
MALTEVTDAQFHEVVLRSTKPVLVDYWADWCTPCKVIDPILSELAAAFGDRMKFVKMDTNRNQIVPTNYRVHGLPTIHIFIDGELVKCFQGAKSKSVLKKAIEDYL